MRHDIYYVLENWAPSLAKSKIYQALIKDIISAKETFRVKEIDNENTYIDLKHTEYQKVIRVDTIEQDSEKSEEEQKKKIEYGCFVDKENSQTFTATVAISEGEGTDLVYSYIEIYCLETYDYFQAVTATISKIGNSNYILKNIQAEKCVYDFYAVATIQELKEGLDNLISVNYYTDFAKELKNIITEGKEKNYIIPDLHLSADIEVDSKNNSEYKISFNGHNDFPSKQLQCEVKPLAELSLDAIEKAINDLSDNAELKEAWNEKIRRVIFFPTSNNNKEIDITEMSYDIDKFIEKVSSEPKIVKQKNRKDG